MKKAFAQLHLAVLLWGFTGVLGKAISLSAPVLVWYRMLLAALFLGIIISLRKEWCPIQKKDIYKLIGIGMLISIHWVAFYASIKLANASIAMICLATASVFTSVFDPLLNRRAFNRNELFISLIAVTGVACIYFLQPKEVSGKSQMINFDLGLLFGIAASIISAIFTVLNKPLANKYPARPLVFAEMTSGVGFLCLLAPFYFFYFPAETLLPVGWDYLWIFLLAYCCTVWGQSLAMAALKHISPFTMTLTVNLEPVYGIFLAFIIFNENAQLGLGFYIGMILIFVSLMMQITVTLNKSRKAKNALLRKV